MWTKLRNLHTVKLKKIFQKKSFELFVSQNNLHYLVRRRHDVFGQSSKMVTNSLKRVSCSLKSLKRTIISWKKSKSLQPDVKKNKFWERIFIGWFSVVVIESQLLIRLAKWTLPKREVLKTTDLLWHKVYLQLNSQLAHVVIWSNFQNFAKQVIFLLQNVWLR